MVQCLGLCAFAAEGPSSIPGQGTKILQVAHCGEKKRRRICQNQQKRLKNGKSILVITDSGKESEIRTYIYI